MIWFTSLFQKKEGKSGSCGISYGVLEVYTREFYLSNCESEKNERNKTFLILLVYFLRSKKPVESAVLAT
jgi:hypothetical protein